MDDLAYATNYMDGYYTRIYKSEEGELIDSPDLRSAPRNWNEEFQSLLGGLKCASNEEERLKIYSSLSMLAHDFIYVAKTYGKIIILERHLPSKRKTIQPIDIGGMAGGEKYITNGILFKFAVDKHNLYGGDDGLAMKAANHELRGLLGYYGAQVTGLHVPLMSIIDYRGFRVTAMSILPVDFTSIVYGSNNGGRTMYNKNTEVAEKMALAAEKMNLKAHFVGRGRRKILLNGPVDIEAHKGHDGRYYVLDFARVFPPEAPEDDAPKASFLFNLLRPELVKRTPFPLSSDAFSLFGKHNKDQHDNEVSKATESLHMKIIPGFARWLDEHVTLAMLSNTDITHRMHRAGVNMRHLGRVRLVATTKLARKALLQEMLARVIKCQIKSIMRRKMEEIRLPMKEVYREEVVQYLNKLLGDSAASTHFWSVEIKGLICSKFKKALSEEEYLHDLSLKRQVDFSTLLKRMCELVGVELSSHCWELLESNPTATGGIHLVYQDVKKIKAKTKHMDIVSFAEGASYCIRAILVDEKAPAESDRLFQLAYTNFQKALGSTPDNEAILKRWGDALCANALRKTGSARTKLAYHALNKYAQTSDGSTSLIQAADTLFAVGLSSPSDERKRILKIVEEYYKKSTELLRDESNWELHYKWGNLLCEQARIELTDVNKKNKLLTAAGTKYGVALTLNPDIHNGIEKWKYPNQAAFALTVLIAQRCGNSFEKIELNRQDCLFHVADDVVRALVDNKHSSIRTLRLSRHSEITNAPFGVVPHRCKSLSSHMLTINKSSSPSPLLKINKSKQSKLTSSPLYAMEKKSTLHPLPTIDKENSSTNGGSQCDVKYNNLPMRKNSEVRFPNIVELDLSGTQVTSDLLPLLVQHCPRLHSLDLSDCSGLLHQPYFSFNDVESLAFVQLTELKLGRCKRMSDPLLIFIIERSPILRMLTLSNCSSLTETAIAQIGEFCPSIQSLDLSFTAVGTTSLMAVVNKCTSIQYLKLRGCRSLTKKALTYVAKCCCSLRSLTVNGCNYLSSPLIDSAVVVLAESCNDLQGLDLSRCKVTDTAIVTIATYCTGLKSLALDECKQVTDEAIVALAEHCKDLQKLRVGGLYKISTGMASLATRCNLTHLSINGCDRVTSAAVHVVATNSPNLQIFEAQKCNQLSNDALVAITKNCNHLIKLDLSQCRQMNSEVLYSVSVNCLELQHLSLSWCLKFSAVSLEGVARSCKHLRAIELAECKQVNDKVIMELAYHARGISSWILTNCCKISDKGILAITAYSGSRTKVMHLSGCYKLTDTSVSRIANSCNQLEVLCLGHCYKITDSAVMRLARHVSHSLQILVLNGCRQVSDVAALRITTCCTSLVKLNLDSCKVSRRTLFEIRKAHPNITLGRAIPQSPT